MAAPRRQQANFSGDAPLSSERERRQQRMVKSQLEKANAEKAAMEAELIALTRSFREVTAALDSGTKEFLLQRERLEREKGTLQTDLGRERAAHLAAVAALSISEEKRLKLEHDLAKVVALLQNQHIRDQTSSPLVVALTAERDSARTAARATDEALRRAQTEIALLRARLAEGARAAPVAVPNSSSDDDSEERTVEASRHSQRSGRSAGDQGSRPFRSHSPLPRPRVDSTSNESETPEGNEQALLMELEKISLQKQELEQQMATLIRSVDERQKMMDQINDSLVCKLEEVATQKMALEDKVAELSSIMARSPADVSQSVWSFGEDLERLRHDLDQTRLDRDAMEREMSALRRQRDEAVRAVEELRAEAASRVEKEEKLSTTFEALKAELEMRIAVDLETHALREQIERMTTHQRTVLEPRIEALAAKIAERDATIARVGEEFAAKLAEARREAARMASQLERQLGDALRERAAASAELLDQNASAADRERSLQAALDLARDDLDKARAHQRDVLAVQLAELRTLAQERQAALERASDEARVRIGELRKALTDANRRTESIRGDLEREHREHEALQSRFEDLTRRTDAHADTLDRQREDVERDFLRQRSQLEAKAASVEALIGERDRTISRLAQEYASKTTELRAELKGASEELERVRNELRDVRADRELLVSRINPAEHDRSSDESLRAELDRISTQQADMARQQQAAANERVELLQSVAARREERITELERQVDVLRNTQDELVYTVKTLRDELDEARVKLDAARAERSRVEAELKAVQAQFDRQAVDADVQMRHARDAESVRSRLAVREAEARAEESRVTLDATRVQLSRLEGQVTLLTEELHDKERALEGERARYQSALRAFEHTRRDGAKRAPTPGTPMGESLASQADEIARTLVSTAGKNDVVSMKDMRGLRAEKTSADNRVHVLMVEMESHKQLSSQLRSALALAKDTFDAREAKLQEDCSKLTAEVEQLKLERSRSISRGTGSSPELEHTPPLEGAVRSYTDGPSDERAPSFPRQNAASAKDVSSARLPQDASDSLLFSPNSSPIRPVPTDSSFGASLFTTHDLNDSRGPLNSSAAAAQAAARDALLAAKELSHAARYPRTGDGLERDVIARSGLPRFAVSSGNIPEHHSRRAIMDDEDTVVSNSFVDTNSLFTAHAPSPAQGTPLRQVAPSTQRFDARRSLSSEWSR